MEARNGNKTYMTIGEGLFKGSGPEKNEKVHKILFTSEIYSAQL